MSGEPSRLLATPLWCSSPPTPTRARCRPSTLAASLGRPPPVSTWPVEQQRAFLTEYTWPIRESPLLLTVHPGDAPADLARYLDPSMRPEAAGPHVLWPGRTEVSIW